MTDHGMTGFRAPMLALAAALLTSGCVMEAPPPLPDMSPTCGADALQGLVGQPASVLETMRFGKPVRIIRPGTAVTMDYSPDRLNIEIDAREKIIRVACG
jgi:hypothetical protein